MRRLPIEAPAPPTVTPSQTLHRRTVAAPVVFEGHGIHFAAPGRLEVLPAPSGHGLQAVVAGSDAPPLPLLAEYAVVAECDRRTVLRGPQGQCFQQLEHIMAALAAEGISDALLRLEGPEPPFLDGGSARFCEGLRATGATGYAETMEPLVITEPAIYHDGFGFVAAIPHEGLRLTSFVEFPGTVVGSAGFSLEITADAFLAEAAPARTFVMEADIEALKKIGLARGGNLENAVVFNETGYLNEQLRFDNEVVRHKIVDLLGDLALLGRPLRGHFWAWRAGHRQHAGFARFLLGMESSTQP